MRRTESGEYKTKKKNDEQRIQTLKRTWLEAGE
jgi:hypothetical protein